MALRTTVVGCWRKLDAHEQEPGCYHRGELDPAQGDDLLNRFAEYLERIAGRGRRRVR
jgi:hypothetical protein